MANPSASPSGFLDALTATTVQDILPTVADNVYRSDVLFAMLRENNLRTWSGRQINENFLYDVENGGFYGTGDTFNITQKQVNTAGSWLPEMAEYGRASAPSQDPAGRGRPATL